MLVCFLAAWGGVALLSALIAVLWRRMPSVAEAPLLDVTVSLLTWVPWVAAAVYAGWGGVLGCVLGQFLALQTFVVIHGATRPRPPGSIRRTLDKFVGPARNHLGLWLTIPALPMFLMIRAAEIVVYPGLIATLGFPRIKDSEWVNVSRQKFSGLIGHDLVWCLYCDWMTGVYSLGAEMLRNVESFWCPIRFYPDKKCENCRLDFPDLEKWVPADKTMKEVEEALEAHYSSDPAVPRSWWGSKERQEG